MLNDNTTPESSLGNLRVCLSSAYLAPVEYYAALARAETVYLECCDYYIKQTYRNRCHIAAANGLMALSIPVEKADKAKATIRDIRISEHADWQMNHWKSIESAYRSTPFFEYYKDDLFPFYEKQWTFLWDLNLELQTKLLELFDINPVIRFTEEYQPSLVGIQDLRDSIHPKKANLVESHNPYYQVFEQKIGFLPNLSIIDLLFNMGNESILTLIK